PGSGGGCRGGSEGAVIRGPPRGSGSVSLRLTLGEGAESSVPAVPAPRPKGVRGRLTHYLPRTLPGGNRRGVTRWLPEPSRLALVVGRLLRFLCKTPSGAAAGPEEWRCR